MAAKKKKSSRRRMVCPKTYRGRKVTASKGGCYIKTRVKKVRAKGRTAPKRRRRAKR